MAESYSVKAVLSAVDRGFTSTLKGCTGALDNIGRKISGFSFGIMAGAGQAAFNAVTSSVTGLIGEIDDSNAAWKTFEKNMEIVEKSGGKLEKSTADVKKELQEFAQQTVYSSSDMASTYAQLAAVGTKNTAKLVKGFGGLAAAAENPQQAMKTLSQQATQMAAKPTVAWADFKLMLEQTPAGIAAVAKHMGMTTAELVTAVQDGEVSTSKFFDAIQKVGTNESFTKLATEAKTVGQAMDGLKETVGNKLTPAFDVLNQVGIKAINAVSDKLAGIDADSIADKVSKLVEKVSSGLSTAKRFAQAFISAFAGVKREAVSAFKYLTTGLGLANKSFNETKAVRAFRKAIRNVALAIKSVFTFVKDNAGTFVSAINTGMSTAKKVWGAFKSTATKVGGAIMDVIKYLLANSDVFMDVLAAGVDAARPYWEAFTNTLVWAVGIVKKVAVFFVEHADTIKKMIPYIFGAVAAFKGFNVIKTVLPFVRGFASSIGSIASKVAGGLTEKLFGVGKAQDSVGKTSKTSGANMLKSAQALALTAVAVLLIAASFAVLAQSAIALSNSGGLAIGVMAGLVIGVAALGLGMAALLKSLAPMSAQLMPAALAMLALGAAVVLVAAGFAVLAAVAINLSDAGGLAIGVMAGLVAVVALLAVGAAALAPVLTAGSVGFLAFGAAIVMVGAGAVLAAAALAIVASVLPTICEYGLQGSVAILALGSSMTVFAVGAAAAGAACVVLGAGLVVAAAGLVAFDVALVASAASMLILEAAIVAVSSTMKTIAKNAQKTENALKSMEESVSVVECGLNALGSKAKDVLKSLTEAFDDSAKEAKTAGKKVGNNFANSLNGGLTAAVGTANSVVSSVVSALNSGYGGAYSAGSYVSQGFANGMWSQVASIRAAAAQMAAAAEEAIRAKAKIHSPSRVAEGLGEYYGEGYVDGMLGMVKDAWRAARELVSIPQIATPKLATAYGFEMSSDYEYSQNHAYVIEVPLAVDGKEFARATASYSQSELNRRQTRENRKKGKV